MKTFNELCKTEVIELAKLAIEMQNTNVELLKKLEAANHDYNELMKERADYVAENKRLKGTLRIGCYCNRKELIRWLEENKVISDQPFEKESVIVLRMIVLSQALKGK